MYFLMQIKWLFCSSGFSVKESDEDYLTQRVKCTHVYKMLTDTRYISDDNYYGEKVLCRADLVV